MTRLFSPFGGQTYTLLSSIGSTDNTILLSSFTVPTTGAPVTMALLNTTIAFGTIAPKTTTKEFISWTGITQNAGGSALLTGVTRGLAFIYPFTSDPAYKLPHSGNTPFIVSNPPQLYEEYGALLNDNAWGGLNVFSEDPQSLVDPVSPNDLTRLSYVQALVLGTLTTINVIVPGTAGATIAIGNAVYFDTGTNRWLLTDATDPLESNNVLLGIAQGAGTSGNPIAGGVLLQGVDSHQTGMTPGVVQFLSNTPGAISGTPGTINVTVGIAEDATHLYFAPRFNDILTKNQLDALVGDNGNPSATNLFITQTGLQYNAESSGTTTGGVTTVIGTFTVTIASPAVFTLNNHGLIAGDSVTLATSGALPTGLAAATTYYVIATGLTANNFQLSATKGGGAINTSGTQSGVHTLTLTTNNYILTLVPQPVSTNGIQATMKASFTSTGPSTIQIGTLPRVWLYKTKGGSTTIDVASGDITTGQEVYLKNDGTNFQFISSTATLGNKVLLSATPVTVTNATGNLFSVAIPGGLLGTANAIKVRVFVNGITLGASSSGTCNLTYGGSTIASVSFSDTSGQGIAGGSGYLDLLLQANASTGSQIGMATLIAGTSNIATSNGTGGTISTASSGAVSVDSTVSQNLVLQFVANVNGAAITMLGYSIELIS